MARFEDSLALFGSESGNGTDGPFTCGWCGKHYTETPGDTAVLWDQFGDKQIGYCCFEKIEAAVMAKMRDIIGWYERRVTAGELNIRERRSALEALGKVLSKPPIRDASAN